MIGKCVHPVSDQGRKKGIIVRMFTVCVKERTSKHVPITCIMWIHVSDRKEGMYNYMCAFCTHQ